MGKRFYDKGSLFGVSIGADEIEEFRDRWPASGLSGLRSVYAEFEKRSGDLVDLKTNDREGAGRWDGEALVALTNDMQCWGEAKLGIDTGRGCPDKPDWKEYLGMPKGASTKQHATKKKTPAQLQREIDEVLAAPSGASGTFDPPGRMNVVDRHGGFTAVTRSGTLWRPGKAAPGGTLGSLVPGSVKRDDFYQNKQPVVSALYKLPSYGYKVKVWWEPSGARIA